MPTPPFDFVNQLPNRLLVDEPYYFLSIRQRSICFSNPTLSPYAPSWLPHRRIADALGHSHDGIENALRRCPSIPYVWATELENVHSYWYFDEPSFDVDGVHYTCREDYYHRQKPRPFDSDLWEDQRDAVMRAAVRHKFGSDTNLRDLLRSTAPHPLCSIKEDDYWGITPAGVGKNMLARVLMELRNVA